MPFVNAGVSPGGGVDGLFLQPDEFANPVSSGAATSNSVGSNSKGSSAAPSGSLRSGSTTEALNASGSHQADRRRSSVRAATQLQSTVQAFFARADHDFLNAVPRVRAPSGVETEHAQADSDTVSDLFAPHCAPGGGASKVQSAFRKARFTPASETVAMRAIGVMLSRLSAAHERAGLPEGFAASLQSLLQLPSDSSNADIAAALRASDFQMNQPGHRTLAATIVSNPRQMSAALNIIQSTAFADALGLTDRLHYRVGGLSGQQCASDPAFASFANLFSVHPIKLQARQPVRLQSGELRQRGQAIPLPADMQTLEHLLTHFEVDPSIKGAKAGLFTSIEFLPVSADADSTTGGNPAVSVFPGRQFKIMFSSGFNEETVEKQSKPDLEKQWPERTLGFSARLTSPVALDCLAQEDRETSTISVTLDCLTPPYFPNGKNEYRSDEDMHRLASWLHESKSADALIHLCARHFPQSLVETEPKTGKVQRSVARVETVPAGVQASGNHRLFDTEYMAMTLVKKLGDHFRQVYQLQSAPAVRLSMFSTFAPCLSCNQGMLLSMFDSENYPDLQLRYWATDDKRPVEVFD